MQAVISNRDMDAVTELRKRGVKSIPCVVLVDGARQSGLLGPRIEGSHNDVRVIVDGKQHTVALGQVSVGAEVAARIAVVVAELDAAQDTAEAAYRKRLANRAQAFANGARRDLSGRYVGHHVEPAGRR